MEQAVEVAQPAWLTIFGVCGLAVGVGAVIIAVIGSALIARTSRSAGNPDEVAQLREEVARLREEIERLKKGPVAGSTDIKGV